MGTEMLIEMGQTADGYQTPNSDDMSKQNQLGFGRHDVNAVNDVRKELECEMRKAIQRKLRNDHTHTESDTGLSSHARRIRRRTKLRQTVDEEEETTEGVSAAWRLNQELF